MPAAHALTSFPFEIFSAGNYEYRDAVTEGRCNRTGLDLGGVRHFRRACVVCSMGMNAPISVMKLPVVG